MKPYNETGATGPIYTAQQHWASERPRSMVVFCSDGRLQASIDEFLSTGLGIVDYDRICAPGGPAVLSAAGESASARTQEYRSDLAFLLEAHSFSRVVLIFHGATDDGPADSVCAHYRRTMPGRSYAEVTARHLVDCRDVFAYLHELRPSLQIEAYRAEVGPNQDVRFVEVHARIG